MKGKTRMRRLRSHIIPSLLAVLVAAPLLYFHLVGRREEVLIGVCATAGPRDLWEYGWPAIYGSRINEAWWDEPQRLGPLQHFNGQSLLLNSVVTMLMIAGAIHVARSFTAAVQERQVSLRAILLLPVVAAGILTFVRYDRSADLMFFVVPATPARFADSVFRTLPVTDFPVYLTLPLLIGVASGVYTAFSITVAVVAKLCRMACFGSDHPRRRRQHRILAVGGLVCLTGVAVYLASAVCRLRTVCHTAVYGRLATEWTACHVFCKGDWPRSWDAIREVLRKYPASFDPGEERLIENVKAYVAIDFEADVRVVSNQTVEEFDAIRPMDGYGVDHRAYWDVERVIDAYPEWKEFVALAKESSE